jgi:GT2 family glycosyltransferase
MRFLLLLLAPLDWALLAFVVAAEIAGRALRLLRPIRLPELPLCKPECSCVMVSWHAKAALKESLPALHRAVRKEGGNHEIIVVVDFEVGEDTEEYVRANFPSVRILTTDRPLYFARATRLGIRAATRDIVVLVDNDVIVDEDFLAPLIEGLREPRTFGVASCVRESSDSHQQETGLTRMSFHGRGIYWKHEPILAKEQKADFVEVSWLHREAYAFDRRKFHTVGNFDDLYDPVYFEDADLSWRAWRFGWKCLLATKSSVSHQHRRAVPEAGRAFLQTIVQRNSYIFVWKNITDIPRLVRYCCTETWIRSHRAHSRTSVKIELRALGAAIKRLPRILRTRIRIDRMSTKTGTQEVLLARQTSSELAQIPHEVV